MQRDHDSDIDELDFDNFKGIYFEEDPNRKYQDPETGCHFEYYDLCKRMAKLKQLRKRLDIQLGLPPETPSDKELSPKTGQRGNSKRTDLRASKKREDGGQYKINYLVKAPKSNRKSVHADGGAETKGN